MYKNSALPSRPGMQSTSQHAQRHIVSATFAIVVFALASTTLACASGGYVDHLGLQPRGALLIVNNNTIDDQPVFLVTGGSEALIGTVTSFSTRTFLISRGQISRSAEYRLASHRFGMRGGIVTDPFSLSLGNTIRWTIDIQHLPSVQIRSFNGSGQ